MEPLVFIVSLIAFGLLFTFGVLLWIFAFGFIFIGFLVFCLLGAPLLGPFSLYLLALGLPLSAVTAIVIALPIVFYFEVVLKLVLLQRFSPLRFVPVEPDAWSLSDQSELAHYTMQLEQLGFVALIDYSLKYYRRGQKPLVRLFAHPQEFCFAEIMQQGLSTISCGVSCHLEQQREKRWTLSMTNLSRETKVLPISHIFLYPPHTLVQQLASSPIEPMFQALLSWRDEVSSELSIAPIREIQAKTFFKSANDRRAMQRKAISRTSILYSTVTFLWLQLQLALKPAAQKRPLETYTGNWL